MALFGKGVSGNPAALGRRVCSRAAPDLGDRGDWLNRFNGESLDGRTASEVERKELNKLAAEKRFILQVT